MEEYDADNIFAQKLDGKSPCFKVFESRHTLAFLNEYPSVEGHTLVLPKIKGYTSFINMPCNKTGDFLRDLHKVATIVKDATGAQGVSILNDNGDCAGQMVFHPHFHIVPRFRDDGLVLQVGAMENQRLTNEQAERVLRKIQTKAEPPKPLRKATYVRVVKIRPDSSGFNITVKVLEEPMAVEGKTTFYDCVCGDSSGTVVLSLHEEQRDLCIKGKTIDVRNAKVKMVKNHIRVIVDKWGKIEESAVEIQSVETSEFKNVSNVEYELVRPKNK